MSQTNLSHQSKLTSELLNKVPEVTIWFWVIKILCTTVGESAADYLNINLGWGLTGTSIATGLVLAIVLTIQIALRSYVASVYWLTVVLVSVFGTLVTDNMTDNLGVPLEVSTVVFALVLGLVFLAWYLVEGTLSIHSIYTRRREGFYWLAIFVTFALGTAVGDLVSEGLGVGYFWTGVLCATLILITTLAWRFGLNAVLAFWIAYILTRPLGASLGDYLAQPTTNGGLGLGVTITSLIFLSAIVATIIYLTVRKPDVATHVGDSQLARDESKAELEIDSRDHGRKSALVQTIAVVALLVVGGLSFYNLRSNSLNADATASAANSPAGANPLGDVNQFVTISQDSLNLVNAGKQSDAKARIADLETAWDQASATLKRKAPQEWDLVDVEIDAVLQELRSASPQVDREKQALDTLLHEFASPSSM